MVYQQIKVLILSIVAVFRRALCIFSRQRRKSSFSDPVECIVIDKSYTNSKQHPERDWNSWDDTPRTVEEHIEQYRQKLAKPATPPKEQEPDFFTELEPVIKPQLKVYLGNEQTQEQQKSTNFSRLAANTDVPIATNADLEDWAEEEPGGWEELDSEQTKQLIREKRREMRQQRNMEKSTKINFNGIEGNHNPRIAATRLSGQTSQA